jgi:hypothetical protein
VVCEGAIGGDRRLIDKCMIARIVRMIEEALGLEIGFMMRIL